MPVTLAQAKLNTQDDLDAMVIDEFRKQDAILDSLIFHDAVNPMGGGSTLTYGYHRVTTQRSAAFRAINAEYVREKAEKARFTTDLKPLGGNFGIDRVLAQTARGSEVEFQLEQLIKATRAKFTDELINGDTAVDVNGFDGLDEALTGSTTEFDAGDDDTLEDWTGLTSDKSHQALDTIDLLFSLLDGLPTVIVGNDRSIAKLRAVARRANQYTREPVAGLTDGSGAPVQREYFGNGLLVDAGEKPGSTDRIIPMYEKATVPGHTDIYVYRVGLDGFHGVSVADQPLVRTWLPDFDTAGAVKDGEVEMGPATIALKATKAAAVLRGIKVQ